MLPSDAGSTSGASSWVSGLFDVARDAVADVATELSSFTTFQNRVDALIHDLKGSQAGPRQVGQERLVRHQFGGGAGAWAEAAGLFSAYETVISELETLSKLLSDSMEGMGIAVMASHKGYQDVDLDIRDRMAAISAETTEHYGGSYDPEGSSRGHDGGNGTQTGQAPRPAPTGGDAGGSI
ncbi:hypothetical protein [Streptomyces sp. BK340]|uniref:hypothetical protein n=1 Tax=Streptomyces sp. BK340 TaxID=2572903 RepID=UPI0011AC959B|nr:hypothetical protein [Streptomyces sp. BK340]TVZ75920.1 hypothetical protein FB157_1481 [Streptomyces sp. BK340]